jgi:hypothetical protein
VSRIAANLTLLPKKYQNIQKLTCSRDSRIPSKYEYGEGDSGGSDTSDTGVNGWMCGGDIPNKVLEIFIVQFISNALQ